MRKLLLVILPASFVFLAIACKKNASRDAEVQAYPDQTLARTGFAN